MNEGSHGTNVQPAGRWQKVLNENWPPADVARRLNDRPVEEQIPVSVRVVFTAGEERLDGMAARWTRMHGYVIVADQRIRNQGIWVLAADIQRR